MLNSLQSKEISLAQSSGDSRACANICLDGEDLMTGSITMIGVDVKQMSSVDSRGIHRRCHAPYVILFLQKQIQSHESYIKGVGYASMAYVTFPTSTLP
jgi:hypothetical protein